VKESVAECFQENLVDFPPIVPVTYDSDPSELLHVRLHNGSIWRWNRPLLQGGAHPHVRIEHRSLPSGPTFVDSAANAAFYYGLVEQLATRSTPPESQCSFEDVKSDFYRAAEVGLEASVLWFDRTGDRNSVRTLVLEDLLPLAREGLHKLRVDTEDVDLFLGVIQKRVETGQTGAAWQQRFMSKYGCDDMQAMTAAYAERQASGRPVSEWDV
jgi:hypothetical protein